jgi:hypothetical protein
MRPALETQGATTPETVKTALCAFYAAQGLPPDGGQAQENWAIELPGLAIPLPNFAWRKRALPLHDLHHLVTGYPCSPMGEFEMAAWEFAAGRYPHPLATAFCLPLVSMGAVLAPRRTFAAFVRGRSSTTLYSQGLTPCVLDTSLAQLKRELLAHQAPGLRPADVCAYMGWVVAALVWTLMPFMALAFVLRLA